MQKEDKTQLSGRVARQRIFYRHKVLQRLRHFAASNRQVTRVKKITDPVIVAKISLTMSSVFIEVQLALLITLQ